MQIGKKIVFWLPQILIVVLVVAAIYWVSDQIGQEEIREIVARAGIFGPIVFTLLYSLTHIIAPLSGTPFFFAGFAMFGQVFIFYIYLASVISITTNFWISRLWGRRIVSRLVGEKDMVKVDEFAKNYGMKALVFLRLAQGNFTDYISYAFGLTKMRFWPYWIVSILAPIPWLWLWWFVLFPKVGDYGDFLTASLLVFIPGGLVSAILFIKFWRKRSHSG